MAINTALAHLIEQAQAHDALLIIDDDVLLDMELAVVEATMTPHSKRAAARHVTFLLRQYAVEQLYKGR